MVLVSACLLGRLLGAVPKLGTIRTVSTSPVIHGRGDVSEEWRTVVQLLKSDTLYLGSVMVGFVSVFASLAYSVRSHECAVVD